MELGNPFAVQPDPLAQSQPTQHNVINQTFGTQQNFQNQVQQMMDQMQRLGQNPQAIVQQMLSSGQVSQQQFEWARTIANQITGRRF